MPKSPIETQPQIVAGPMCEKLNIFTAGGKGGVGKTTFMVALADWFTSRGEPYSLLDLDTENRTKGGLKNHHKNAVKTNIRKGLDVFLDILDNEEERVVLSDMGAGQGEMTTEWFSALYDEVHEAGVRFLAVCMVTPDPASIESTLQWASDLQKRVNYLVVLNEMNDPGAKFTLWETSSKVQEFRGHFQPAVMKMPSRPSEFQELVINHGATLDDIAERRTGVPTLSMARNIVHAKRHRRVLYAEFERVIPAFLPAR